MLFNFYYTEFHREVTEAKRNQTYGVDNKIRNFRNGVTPSGFHYKIIEFFHNNTIPSGLHFFKTIIPIAYM